MRIIVLLVACLGFSASHALAQNCEYAGVSYSPGSTMCECPSLLGEGGFATGGNAKVTSRRMECTANGWTNSGAMCVDLEYKNTSASGYDAFDKLNNQYCPRLFGDAEVQKFVISAPEGQLANVMKQICNRFKLGAACKAAIDALLNIQN